MIFSVRCDGWTRRPERDSVTIRALTVALAEHNRANVHNGPEPKVPPLYQSGVRYAEETGDGIVMLDVIAVFSDGFSDCKNLVAWRMAEHKNAGVPCDVGITWQRDDSGFWLYHVFLHLSSSIEDPSKILGM